MKENLIPTTVTDKRGRITTVYKKPQQSQVAAKVPALGIPARHYDAVQDKYRRIADDRRPYIEQRRLAKERLEAGGEEKSEIIARINTLVTSTGRDTLVSRIDTHYLESFELMESLLVRTQEFPVFGQQLFERYHAITADAFLAWARVADRNYDALNSSSLADQNTPERLPGFFSAMICLHGRQRAATGEDYSEQQERNYLMLNLSTLNSRLEGRLNRQGGGWGTITFYENEDLEAFAFECDDPEKVERVCALIREGNLTRFHEIVAVADGDTIAPLADGAL